MMIIERETQLTVGYESHFVSDSLTVVVLVITLVKSIETLILSLSLFFTRSS